MSHLQRQLPLDLFAREIFDFDNFSPGPNQEVVSACRTWADGEGPSVLCLWGPEGSGKSHLLQAILQRADHHERRSIYVPLDEIATAAAAPFDGLEQLELVCIDQLDTVICQPLWERAVFDLYNRCQASSTRLVFAARANPRNAGYALADLASRLSAGLIYQLRPLDDGHRRELMRLVAHQRGLSLAPAVIDYLLKRAARDTPSLIELLAQLDRASLSQAREITVPLVREVLHV